MSARSPLSDEDDLVAAELALGLLDEQQRQDAEDRLSRDPAFAAAVAWWQEHAAAMTVGIDQEPSPALWAAIAAKLPANDIPAVSLGRLRLWQGLAGLAAAAAIILGSLLMRPVPPGPAPAPVRTQSAPLVAVLSDPKRDALVTVSIQRSSRTLAVVPAALDPGPRDAQLWVIPSDGKPRALGIVDARRRATLQLDPAVAFAVQPGSTLAVSLEPLGGSPTGLPTGPVILTGKLTQS